MTSTQKRWFWITALMVLIPEILFNITISSFINKSELFLTIKSLFFYDRFFINNPSIFLMSLFIEWFGLLLLTILVTRIKNFKYLSIITGVWFVWFSFVYFLGYTATSINLW